VGLVQHHFFERLIPQRQYYARVAIVVGIGAKLNQSLLLDEHTGTKGPWSPNSYPYKTKEERPPISNELRRQMWASFYVSKDRPKEGSLLENPCLGCMAVGKELVMLSPLLQNVVAAHIIADAKGGPHGEDPKEAWNFVPLCQPCNSDMGTTNAVDWFYRKCSIEKNFLPLFEMLFRLWRGRQLFPEGAPALPQALRWNPPHSRPKVSCSKPASLFALPIDDPCPRVQVLAFAEEFYRHGSESFKKLGGRVEIDGMEYSHSDPAGLQGGFVTEYDGLRDAWDHLDKDQTQMFKRINLLDDMGSEMQNLALKMAKKIRQGTGVDADFMDTGSIVNRINEMLKSWDAGIDGLQ